MRQALCVPLSQYKDDKVLSLNPRTLLGVSLGSETTSGALVLATLGESHHLSKH